MSLDELFESSAAEDVKINVHKEVEKALPDQAKGMMFLAAPTPIVGGMAMPSVRDIRQLEQIEEAFPESSGESTSDDDEWETEIRRAKSLLDDWGEVITYHNFWIQKKTKPKKEKEYTRTVIPYPVPRTYAFTIRPCLDTTDEEEQATRFGMRRVWEMFMSQSTSRRISLNLRNFKNIFLGEFKGIYINWKWGKKASDDVFTIGDFVCVNDACVHTERTANTQKNLKLHENMRAGMLFVWVPPEFTYEVTLEAEKMHFMYKDSVTWGKLNVSNRIIVDKARYFNNSQERCLIFRRVNKSRKNIRFDIRQQRSSDSFFSFRRYDPGLSIKYVRTCEQPSNREPVCGVKT